MFHDSSHSLETICHNETTVEFFATLSSRGELFLVI
jgi:hypothetical protein